METLTKTKWVIDPTHSEVTFKVKHMMISTVTGQFGSFAGELEAESENFEDASINVSIDVNSISTKNEDRDAHLKSDNFFSAEKYPTISFNSIKFEGDTLVGDLTIRDVTKRVNLDVEYNGTAVDPYGQTKAGFELAGEINRKEYNLKWDAVTEAGSIVVSDKVKLVIAAQFVKQA